MDPSRLADQPEIGVRLSLSPTSERKVDAPQVLSTLFFKSMGFASAYMVAAINSFIHKVRLSDKRSIQIDSEVIA